jgi:hypothetical protein
MTGFWRWLAQANARAVLGWAVAACVLVTAYWVWRELTLSPETTVVTADPPGRAQEPQRIGLIELVEGHLAGGARDEEKNPFFHAVRRPPRPQPPVPQPPPQPPPPQPTPQPPPPRPPPPPPQPPPPPPPPPPRQVTVFYRGTLTRPDGRVVALIETREEGRKSFYRADEPLWGVTVTAIGPASVDLAMPDGSTMTLGRGEEGRIPEERP